METERINLRKNKVSIAHILNYPPEVLKEIIDSTYERAREIYALAEFQTIPSVGIRFAEDLVFMGFYSLSELKNKDGALLTDEFERRKGYWIDPCVEDQFRLVVHCAQTTDFSKTWWDFTDERKKFRIKNGYPKDRPQKAWHETIEINSKK
jgi:hypothetical protein